MCANINFRAGFEWLSDYRGSLCMYIRPNAESEYRQVAYMICSVELYDVYVFVDL